MFNNQKQAKMKAKTIFPKSPSPPIKSKVEILEKRYIENQNLSLMINQMKIPIHVSSCSVPACMPVT